jgi:phenylacetate-CoA ligase
MPVIRYRTRDLTRLLPGTRTAMRRMARITGRSDDMLIVRGVNVFPSQLEEIICEQPKLALHYLIHVSRPERLDEMELQVEARADVQPADFSREAALLAERIRQRVGISVRTVVLGTGTLPRSTGKALRVMDHRSV